MEPVWRTVAGMYSIVIVSQCGDLLQEGIVFDAELVCRNIAGRYYFVMQSQCGEHLQ